jgi:hypothetical protein
VGCLNFAHIRAQLRKVIKILRISARSNLNFAHKRTQKCEVIKILIGWSFESLLEGLNEYILLNIVPIEDPLCVVFNYGN